jgi:hypothetical protein
MVNLEEVRYYFVCYNFIYFSLINKLFLGTRFDVYIKVETSPHNLIITYPSAIKVTVDGPRPPRSNC